jgi:hypothetical protein
MDLIYLIAAALLWAAVVGLAHGCDRLRSRASP